MMGAARELAIGGQAVWLASCPRLFTSSLVPVRAIGDRTGTSRSDIRVFPERGGPRESCRVANSLHWSELDALAGPVSRAVGAVPPSRVVPADCVRSGGVAAGPSGPGRGHGRRAVRTRTSPRRRGRGLSAYPEVLRVLGVEVAIEGAYEEVGGVRVEPLTAGWRSLPPTAAAPSSRSRPRAAPIAGGPALVCLSFRSYAQTVAARAPATVAADRPAVAPSTSPAPVSPTAAARAARGHIRPEGRGR